MTTLTAAETSLLQWLGQEDYSQYGECHGREFDALLAKGLVQIHEDRVPGVAFIAPQGRGPMYRAVSLTGAGLLELRALNATT
jgi:hypothetical protein